MLWEIQPANITTSICIERKGAILGAQKSSWIWHLVFNELLNVRCEVEATVVIYTSGDDDGLFISGSSSVTTYNFGASTS